MAAILDPRFKADVFREYSNYTNGLSALKIDLKAAIERRNAAKPPVEVVTAEEPAQNVRVGAKLPEGKKLKITLQIHCCYFIRC